MGNSSRIHGAVCWLALGVMFGSSACVERSEELSVVERERVRAQVSTSPTSPTHPLDLAFGDSVELIGYDVSSERWTPGTELVVTWHWKVLRTVGDDYSLFTHVEGRDMDTLNHDRDGAIRTLYPPSRWKAGEYIRDEQRIHLPATWSANEATFYVGFWRGTERLSVRRGPHDGDHRGRPLTMSVVVASPAPTGPIPLPELIAQRAHQPIVIDGTSRDAAWSISPWSTPFVQTMNGAGSPIEARVRVVYDETSLYVAFQVSDTDLQSPHRNPDDHLWEQDCVEVFIDPDGDGRNYFEIQVSPRGVVFDTRYDRRRQPQPFGNVAWQSGIESAVVLRGTLDDTQVDEGYQVELRIPYASLAVGTPPAAPPVAGGTWRMNFYVMEKSARGQDAAGWSPVLVPDFHATDRFGRVMFRDVIGEIRANEDRPSIQAAAEEIEARGRSVQEAAQQAEAVDRPGPNERRIRRPRQP